MKAYESIDYYGKHWDLPIYAFDKLDGSNLRFEFSQKRGFYKFGTRKTMIDRSHEQFGFAIDLFLNKYQDSISKVMKGKNYRNVLSAVFFAELKGTKSRYGQHMYGNDDFDITLFDVSMYKTGLLEPKRFIDDFGNCGIPKVVYSGNLNKKFVSDVKNNLFGLEEGVICKGQVKGNRLYYCKIKTNEWLDGLRLLNNKEYEEEISSQIYS